MGTLYFDPVELDEEWRRRHVFRWETHTVLDRLYEVREQFNKSKQPPPSVSEILHDVEHAVLAYERPCDEFFDNLFYYTNSEGWAARIAERHWGKHQHRIVIRCRINQANNLTVTFSPSYIDQRGFEVHAPEWEAMPYLGHARIAERPDDELLYIKGAGRLFHGGPGALVRTDKRYADLAELVLATFWLIVHRVARRFDVFVASYVARLTDDAGDIQYGLNIVDVRDDTLWVLRNFIDRFAIENGCKPAEFWATCKDAQTKGGNWTASVSKRLRVKDTPTQYLTPKICENLYKQLDKAFRWGVAEKPRDTVVSDVKGRDWKVIESVPASNNPAPKKAEQRAIGSANVTPFPSRSAGKAVNISAEIAAEFGVTTRDELFKLANKRMASLGRRPLAAGDYPSNKASLARLVRMLRGLRT